MIGAWDWTTRTSTLCGCAVAGTAAPLHCHYSARAQVLGVFDVNKDGSISFDEFLRGIRGSINKRRRGIISQAFDVLDKDRSGEVTLDEIGAAYDVSKHPEVIACRKTREEALSEFMAQWDVTDRDGKVGSC